MMHHGFPETCCAGSILRSAGAVASQVSSAAEAAIAREYVSDQLDDPLSRTLLQRENPDRATFGY
jgi:hypothetical protein